MNRTELINLIIVKLRLKSYCEIGVASGRNFAAIKCSRKVGVDPDTNSKATVFKTSDQFFAGAKKETFDCIFLDGLHISDQVRKDIINAWECLTDGGCLVIHDTNPDREEITHVPRDSKEWCGDVYKAIYQVNNDKFTLNDDHGVTVIRKTGELIIDDSAIYWPEFNEFREEILHLVTWDEAIKIIDGWR